MSKRFIITILTLLFIGVSAGVAIFLAKGYTFSTKDRTIVGTGIITITSTPDAASVYIDGHLDTATNATISSLQPGKYTVKIVKEGFIPWEKEVEVQAGLVTDLKITLFPAIPTVYPLTFTGVSGAIMSPDSSKLGYIVPIATDSATVNKKAGVWVWTFTSDQPISFARGAQPHQIAQSGQVDYSKAKLRWSSDSKQILASVGGNNYLLNDDTLNTDPRDITAVLQSTLQTWDEDQKTKDQARIQSIANISVRQIASSSAVLKWAPDETKFIFGSSNATPSPKTAKVDTGEGALKVYVVKTNKQYDLPAAKNHFWLPDSLHIVLVEDNQISIVDADGSNKAVIYAGTFDPTAVFAWPDSSKLVVINSLPTPTASSPNLYGINLK